MKRTPLRHRSSILLLALLLAAGAAQAQDTQPAPPPGATDRHGGMTDKAAHNAMAPSAAALSGRFMRVRFRQSAGRAGTERRMTAGTADGRRQRDDSAVPP